MTPNEKIEYLKQRTAERKAADLIPDYKALYSKERQKGAPTPEKAETKPKTVRPEDPCTKRGEPTGNTVQCQSCRGTVHLKVLACSEFGTCTVGKRVPEVPGCCNGCKSRVTPGE